MALTPSLFNQLWLDYATLNPSALKIHQLIEARGEHIINDHIALRTFQHEKVGIDVLSQAFIDGGYTPKDEHDFPAKKLYARHYEHEDAAMPKVFISELKLNAFSSTLQDLVEGLIDQVDATDTASPNFPAVGRLWELRFGQYESLRKESEYAAWMAAFGFRANHFTILVNALDTFDGLADLNAFLKKNGFALNNSGGEIKGSAEVYLEQSSTLADEVEVEFSDDGHRDNGHLIPACYYEFAQRYPLPSGKLFSGFVAKSADKIFESTDRR